MGAILSQMRLMELNTFSQELQTILALRMTYLGNTEYHPFLRMLQQTTHNRKNLTYLLLENF